jgi:hypothetical protein
MDALQLSIRVEEFIISRNRVTPCTLAKELQCVTAELKVMLSQCVSQLVLKNNWRTEYINNRLFIVAESAVNKVKKATVVNHQYENPKGSTPKCLPVDGDWIVYTKSENRTRLYFDGSYTSDEARGSYSKSEGIKFNKTLICRYHKLKTFRPMHNFK